MAFTEGAYNFVEIQRATRPKMSPAPFAMLSQTFQWEYLVFEKHGNRHMESYDPCDTGFLEDAQAAVV